MPTQKDTARDRRKTDATINAQTAGRDREAHTDKRGKKQESRNRPLLRYGVAGAVRGGAAGLNK